MPSSFDELEDVAQSLDGASLRGFLLRNAEKIDPKELCDAFIWATVSFVIEGEFEGLTGYDIARKTRGALWPFLVETSSPEAANGIPCPRRPLSLLDLLWNDMGRLPRGKDTPKPWVLRATDPKAPPGEQPQSMVQMVLFGIAATFCEDVADILARTLAAGLHDGRRKVNLRILADEIVIDEGLDPFVTTGTVRIGLLSPLKLSSDGEVSLNYGAMLPTLIDRVDGLAMWHGLKLDCDFGVLRNRARAVHVDEDQAEVGAWERRSGRTNRLVPMLDTRGVLKLSGDFRGLEPFLTLLPIVHVGKDTRHGHGWCSVSSGRSIVRMRHEKEIGSEK